MLQRSDHFVASKPSLCEQRIITPLKRASLICTGSVSLVFITRKKPPRESLWLMESVNNAALLPSLWSCREPQQHNNLYLLLRRDETFLNKSPHLAFKSLISIYSPWCFTQDSVDRHAAAPALKCLMKKHLKSQLGKLKEIYTHSYSHTHAHTLTHTLTRTHTPIYTCRLLAENSSNSWGMWPLSRWAQLHSSSAVLKIPDCRNTTIRGSCTRVKVRVLSAKHTKVTSYCGCQLKSVIETWYFTLACGEVHC